MYGTVLIYLYEGAYLFVFVSVFLHECVAQLCIIVYMCASEFVCMSVYISMLCVSSIVCVHLYQ